MKKFLAILLLALLAFSGCSLFEKEETKAEPAELNSATVLDNEAYKWATSDKNVELCANISDTAKKDECIRVVDALVLTDKAIAELNDDICGEIEIEDYEKNCDAVVKSKLGQKKMEEEKIAELQKDEEERAGIEKEAIEKKDPKICDEIEDENQKSSCKYNVIVNIAIEQKDAKQCEAIESKDMVTECENFVSTNYQD